MIRRSILEYNWDDDAKEAVFVPKPLAKKWLLISKEQESVSRPNGSGIIYGFIGVLIVILGLLLWLGVRPKKAKKE